MYEFLEPKMVFFGDNYWTLSLPYHCLQAVPYHDQWEEVGLVPREVWKSAGSNQLLGLTMPESALKLI